MFWTCWMETDRMQHRPTSLTLRLTVFIGVTTTLVFLAFGWVIQNSIEYHFAEQDADELQVVAEAVRESLLRLSMGRSDAATLENELANAVSGHHGIFFYVADTNGQLIYATPGIDLEMIANTVAAVQRIDPESLHVWKESETTSIFS